MCLVDKALAFGIFEEAKAVGNDDMSFYLTQGAVSDGEKMYELVSRGSSLPFGNVGRN